MIVVRALVDEVSHFREHGKAVREAWRNVELPMCDIVEFNGNVLPKRRRSQSDIDRNIQDTAARRPHELSLRLYKLIVESTHYAIARAGMVVLHKRSEEHTSELQSLMRISYAVFCLKKKKT